MRDVIVVGAGGGGPVVAKELAARGLDVLLLEAGARHADPDTEWTDLENDANGFTTGYLRVGPADRSKPQWYRELPQNSYLWQIAGVGGTTLHYFGNSPRAFPGTFVGYAGADAGAYDVGHPFPFPYEELIPYYEWVEATLPVQTAPMGTKEEVWFRGWERLGYPVQTGKDISRDAYRPQQNAILQPGGTAGRTRDRSLLQWPQATGCTFCGYCLQGCKNPPGAPRNLKAKRSTDNSYVPMAITADAWAPGGRAVTLVTDAQVTRVRFTRDLLGRATARGVTWRDTNTGETLTEDARVVVLSAGCVEGPRLWLNSRLPNPNGWVGRGLTDHAFDWLVGLFPFDTDSSRGAQSQARADFPGRGGMENVGLPPASEGISLALSDSGVRGAYTNGAGPTGAWDGPAGRPLGAELKEVQGEIDRQLNVLILTDDDVEPGNRVDLSVLPPDEHGPVPRVRMAKRTRSARTRANREFLATKAAESLRAAGATKVVRIDMAPLMLHVQSSLRMGTSSADSVLDANGQARWVRGLYVGDNAALANACGGANPTLTTQALATRTAEKIFAAHFGGDAWVATEAPVVSTDERVSAALAAVTPAG
jgi:choline dehydrogenase-like flavoprotein